MNITDLLKQSPRGQLAALEAGFDDAAIDAVAEFAGVKRDEITHAFALPASGGTMANWQAERLLRLARVAADLRDVFTTSEAVSRWLSTPLATLDRSPIELCATDVGAHIVQQYVNAARHGIPR